MARYRIVPERSTLEAEARSSLHPIHVQTTGLAGWFEATVAGDRFDPATPAHGQVGIESARLKTGNILYDHELDRRLEVQAYPDVRGEVLGVRPLDSDGRHAVRGALTFHGVTRPVEGEVRLRVVDDHTLEIEGEHVFDVRDFGIEPPRVLMLRVHPEVRVRGRVVAEREG